MGVGPDRPAASTRRIPGGPPRTTCCGPDRRRPGRLRPPGTTGPRRPPAAACPRRNRPGVPARTSGPRVRCPARHAMPRWQAASGQRSVPGGNRRAARAAPPAGPGTARCRPGRRYRRDGHGLLRGGLLPGRGDAEDGDQHRDRDDNRRDEQGPGRSVGGVRVGHPTNSMGARPGRSDRSGSA